MVAGFMIWVTVASLVTGSLYVRDKRASINDRRRISEKTLLAWSVLGGWPGGLIAGRWVRHKTQKNTYRLRFGLCVIANLIIMVALFVVR